jgi:poly(glycerol-phosphate) alpha-glucosyltransferase
MVHLSHSTTAADGGIASALSQLVEAQKRVGLAPDWIVADRLTSWQRDRALRRQTLLSGAALLHIHGLWRSPTRVASALARGSRSAPALPLVIAPHGMLDAEALRYSRWKKRIVWRLWEGQALRQARCFHALVPAELEAIRSLGFSQPVALIPNGVTLPDTTAPQHQPPWAEVVPAGERVLLFLGRFHAKKGLDPLLQAWRRLAPEATRKGWWLACIGYGDQGELAARLAREPVERCLVLGPCFGAEKEACLASASAFVLPSFSEGLPMAALEAMSWGLPCLLSPACNLPDAVAAGAARLVQPQPADLAAGIQDLMALADSEAAAMGCRGRTLVAERFSWSTIACQCAELYGWILGGGTPPAFVDLGKARS